MELLVATFTLTNMPEKLLVTGANGFIGRALCDSLKAQGIPFNAAIRASATLPGINTFAVGDIGPETDWSAALVGCDTVIHLAARAHVMRGNSDDTLREFRHINTLGALALARQAANAGARRFVYISTIKVNGEQTEPGRPFCPNDAPFPEDAYAISKHEAEQGLFDIGRETGIEIVVIRPPLVYGLGSKANFAALVRWSGKGIPLPLGAIHNQRSFIALENLVSFLVLCADQAKSPLAANEIFLISDGEDVSTSELLHKVAAAYGNKLFLIPVPEKWLWTAARLLGKEPVAVRLLKSLAVDSSKARDLLGWRPVISMDEQLKKMARAEKFAQNSPCQSS